MGLKGIKFHPDYQKFFVDDKKMFPIYETAFGLGLIVVFHAGVDIGLPAPYHATPERLEKIVRTFPRCKVVAAHMGGFSLWDDVERFLVGTTYIWILHTVWTLWTVSRPKGLSGTMM